MQKYSSNVVEKCLEKSHDLALQSFIDEISNPNRAAGKNILFIKIRINEK